MTMTTTEVMTQMLSLMKHKAMDRTPLPSKEAPPRPTKTPTAGDLPLQKKEKGDTLPPFHDFYNTGVFTSKEEHVPSPKPKEAPVQTEADLPQLKSQCN